MPVLQAKRITCFSVHLTNNKLIKVTSHEIEIKALQSTIEIMHVITATDSIRKLYDLRLQYGAGSRSRRSPIGQDRVARYQGLPVIRARQSLRHPRRPSVLQFVFSVTMLSSHPATYMAFSLITIYCSNVPSKPLTF